MAIRTERRWAIALRTHDGGIHTEAHDTRSRLGANRLALVRGVVAVAEAIGIGLDAMRVWLRVTTGTNATRRDLAPTLAGIGSSVLLLFVAGPAIAVAATRWHGAGADAAEAGLRVAMLVVYLALVGRSAAVARLFGYHGAEHEVIGAFEQLGRMPSPEEARRIGPVHDRCGTTFAMLFVIVAGVLYPIVPRSPLWAGAIVRIALVPVVCALSYELMRIAARERDARWARIVIWPGRAAQRLTTREPDDGQLEVAAAALRELLSG